VLLSKQFVIDKKAHRQSLVIILAYYLARIPVNNLFIRLMPDFIFNYAYSMRLEIETPMETFYGWGKPGQFLGNGRQRHLFAFDVCFGSFDSLAFLWNI